MTATEHHPSHAVALIPLFTAPKSLTETPAYGDRPPQYQRLLSPIAGMCAGYCVRTSAFSPVTGRLAPNRISAGERVPETAICLVISMATVTFSVVPKKNRTYQVELVRPDGSRRTIPGFRSEHEAQAWGIQAERMMSAERPRLDMKFAGRQTNRPSGEH